MQDVVISALGQLCADTGVHTGRAANDKYIVDQDCPEGPAGKRLSEDEYDQLQTEMFNFAAQLKNKYVVQFIAAGRKIELVCELEWHAEFAKNMFGENTFADIPDFVIWDFPSFQAKQGRLANKTFIACSFGGHTNSWNVSPMVLISGTKYAGEIKKSVFSYLSYVLPKNDILPMHSSVSTYGISSTNVFFGLSGTGKTTLSASGDMKLLGDDEHGWDDRGLFNFEKGCYAKAIDLSPEGEPLIWKAVNSPGTILENVTLDSAGRPVFTDRSKTENTRAAYPLSKIQNSYPVGAHLNHPTNIIMLTCDAFGVLPGVSKLSYEAALFHFASGYTAKVAGTEKGLTEPTAVFSRCFGAPFMPLPLQSYLDLFEKKLNKHRPNVWLINTGWVGGPPGVGKRSSLAETRKIVQSIVDGSLKRAVTQRNELFNLDVVSGTYNFKPKSTWADGPAYDVAASKLVSLFRQNARELGIKSFI